MEINIDQVAIAFADWRARRTKRGHTPSHLIDQAVSLVGKYTKLQITTRLGINHKMLNRWINSKPSDNTFIDMTPHYTEINRQPLEVVVNCAFGMTLKLTGETTAIASLLLTLQQGGGA